MPTGYIYVLSLKGDNWYVGSTRHLEQRLKSHQGKIHGRGNSWVKRHGIVGNTYYQTHPVNSDKSILQEELWMTLQYMEKYGYEKVRGSVWVADSLVKDAKEFTRRLIAETKDACYNCGKTGHKQDKCPQRKLGRRFTTTVISTLKNTWGTLRKIAKKTRVNINPIVKELETQIKLMKSELSEALSENEKLCEKLCQVLIENQNLTVQNNHLQAQLSDSQKLVTRLQKEKEQAEQSEHPQLNWSDYQAATTLLLLTQH